MCRERADGSEMYYGRSDAYLNGEEEEAEEKDEKGAEEERKEAEARQRMIRNRRQRKKIPGMKSCG
jgi:hypothetical protein